MKKTVWLSVALLSSCACAADEQMADVTEQVMPFDAEEQMAEDILSQEGTSEKNDAAAADEMLNAETTASVEKQPASDETKKVVDALEGTQEPEPTIETEDTSSAE